MAAVSVKRSIYRLDAGPRISKSHEKTTLFIFAFFVLDINECKNSSLHNCNLATPGVTCVNTPGSFQCACKEAFSGNGVTCNGTAQSLFPK